MSAIDDLVQSNAAYADLFAKGDLPITPARGVAVVTCMDARLLPSRFLPVSRKPAVLYCSLQHLRQHVCQRGVFFDPAPIALIA